MEAEGPPGVGCRGCWVSKPRFFDVSLKLAEEKVYIFSSQCFAQANLPDSLFPVNKLKWNRAQ
jgi:hypothetical protein